MTAGQWRQVNREGNSLINELIIGTGSKDKFSTDFPVNDKQFANFVLNPLLAQLFASVFGVPVPPPPRNDLLCWCSTSLRSVQDAVQAIQGRSQTCCA